MKKIAIAIAVFAATSIGVFADGDSTYTQRYADIEYYDFDFQVDISDSGKATARWNSYLQNRGFTNYKLMYSTKYANPSYPELSAKYVGSDIDDTGGSLYLSQGDTHYFRICAITDEGYGVTGRYCSTTIKESFDSQSNDTKATYTKETYSKNSISSELQTTIDERIEGFMDALESKYSDDEIVSILDEIIAKLDDYIDNDKYSAIALYMQELLQEYRTQYEDALDIFDDIFGEY